MLTHSKLRRIMAQAVRDRAADVDPRDAAERATQTTGLRRALWASYTVEVRASLIRGAIRDAREEASQ